MRVSLAFLERCSGESGFPVAGLEKVVRLGAMAADIGRHPLLSTVLLLKGGTALNLAFGPPERLSVDLDFNYIGALERADMVSDRPRIERALEDLAQRSGYRVQRSAESFAGRKMFLHYGSVLGPLERIELDVNYLLRLPLDPPRIVELWQPGELDRPRLLMVGDEELVIGKLCALLDRCAARDVWDVACLRPQAAETFGRPNFRGRFLTLAATLTHSPETYTERRLREHTTQRQIDEQLVPLLASGSGADAADLVQRAWARLAPLVALGHEERAFFEGVETGDINLSPLFPTDGDEGRRLSAHPALRWKAQNARSHREGG